MGKCQGVGALLAQGSIPMAVLGRSLCPLGGTLDAPSGGVGVGWLLGPCKGAALPPAPRPFSGLLPPAVRSAAGRRPPGGAVQRGSETRIGARASRRAKMAAGVKVVELVVRQVEPLQGQLEQVGPVRGCCVGRSCPAGAVVGAMCVSGVGRGSGG